MAISKAKLNQLKATEMDVDSTTVRNYLEALYSKEEIESIQGFLRMVAVSAAQLKNLRSTRGYYSISAANGIGNHYIGWGEGKGLNRAQMKKNKLFQKIEKEMAKRFEDKYGTIELKLQVVIYNHTRHQYLSNGSISTTSTSDVGIKVLARRSLTESEKESHRRWIKYEIEACERNINCNKEQLEILRKINI
jgi:hypothetical protein